MQSAATRRITRSSRYNKIPPKKQGWTYSPILVLLLGAVGLFMISTALFYASWDRMPERVQYIPRAIEAQVFPAAPHDEFVAAPVDAIAPEEALQQLGLSQPNPSTMEDETGATTGTDAEIVSPVTDSGQTTQADDAVATGTDEVAAASSPAEEVAQEEAVPVAVSYTPAAPAARLDGIRHEFQGWNNCGPATLAMGLSYFGRSDTQRQTAPFLKPDSDDKNVSPNEMVAYAESIGYHGQVVVGSDLEMLRTLVTNNVPVIVETWYVPDPNDEMGHYLLLTGYEGEQFFFHDSYKGPDIPKQAQEFDQYWKVFNRTAVVIWPPEQEALVSDILGERGDETAMFQHALEVARNEVNANPQDKFAWFNLGTNLAALGESEGAAQAYNTARSLQLPWRMLWYQFGPYQAYYESGNYNEVVNLANTTLSNATNLEESYYWRGMALAAMGRPDEARRDFQQAVRLNPNFAPAHEGLATLQ